MLTIDPEDLQAHYNLMLCYQGLGDAAGATRERVLYERFKADESSQAITGPYRQLHPKTTTSGSKSTNIVATAARAATAPTAGLLARNRAQAMITGDTWPMSCGCDAQLVLAGSVAPGGSVADAARPTRPRRRIGCPISSPT